MLSESLLVAKIVNGDANEHDALTGPYTTVTLIFMDPKEFIH
jgi:hypothetical protein